MSVRFRSFDVLKYVNDAFTLKWEIENIPAGFSERVNVFRSESQGGPWEPLASDISGKEYYHDFTARMRNPEVTIYYKLTGYVTDGGAPPNTQEIKASRVEWFRQAPDAVAAEMIRRNNLLLQYYSGFKCMILVRRTWGPHCVACYDSVLGTGTSADCPECFNTKFHGGFYDPILTYVGFMEAGQARRDLQVLTTAPDVRQFWTTNIPELKKGDVLIDNQNQRWKIEAVRMKTSRMGTTVRQMFNAAKVPPDDVLTRLDVRNIWKFTPKRDYHIWVEKSTK